jgi:hypothetical protein
MKSLLARLLSKCARGLRTFGIGLIGLVAVSSAHAYCPTGSPATLRQLAAAEAASLASGARVAVAEHFANFGVFPSSNAEAMLPAPTAFQIDLNADGIPDVPPCFVDGVHVQGGGNVWTILREPLVPGFIRWFPVNYTIPGTTIGGWHCETNIPGVLPECRYVGPNLTGKALTWGVNEYDESRYVTTVHCWSSRTAPTANGGCDAYEGDTDKTSTLPILCFNPQSVPAPAGLPNPSNPNNGWSGGHIALSDPVLGTDVTSLANANARCAGKFGSGWRMASFHDGNGGWGFRAYGAIPNQSRFWVHIKDQPANLWD